MTPLEFKETRKRLNKTQKDLAIQFCVSIRTVKRYESGDTPIPFWVEVLFDENGVDGGLIVGDPHKYIPLEEIINSHDFTSCVEVEWKGMARSIYLFGCDVDGKNLEVTEYMRGDTIASGGNYMVAGSWFTVEGNKFDLQLVVDAFLRNYPAKAVEVYVGGIGVSKLMEINNDPNS